MLLLTDTVDHYRNTGVEPDTADRQLISLIQKGLPLSERPYRDIAVQLGMSESDVMRRIASLQEEGLIKRFGIIVRHHELGFMANAMVVWDIPDNMVHEVANRMKIYPFISLCYRRPRILPDWSYNLFCMIHGRKRSGVLRLLNLMIAENNWHEYPYEVLFSKRRFKQRGAMIPVDEQEAGERTC